MWIETNRITAYSGQVYIILKHSITGKVVGCNERDIVQFLNDENEKT